MLTSPSPMSACFIRALPRRGRRSSALAIVKPPSPGFEHGRKLRKAASATTTVFAWRWDPQGLRPTNPAPPLPGAVDLTPRPTVAPVSRAGRDNQFAMASVCARLDKQPPKRDLANVISESWSSFAIVWRFRSGNSNSEECELVVCYRKLTGETLGSRRGETFTSVIGSNRPPLKHPPSENVTRLAWEAGASTLARPANHLNRQFVDKMPRTGEDLSNKLKAVRR